MFNRLKYLSLTVVGVFCILSPALAATSALGGLDRTADSIPAFKEQKESDENFLQTRTGQIIGLVLSFIGVLFLILMIYAGITWMTSAGNQDKVKQARDLMLNAIIGLVIVLSAYAIVSFLGSQLIQQ